MTDVKYKEIEKIPYITAIIPEGYKYAAMAAVMNVGGKDTLIVELYDGKAVPRVRVCIDDEKFANYVVADKKWNGRMIYGQGYNDVVGFKLICTWEKVTEEYTKLFGSCTWEERYGSPYPVKSEPAAEEPVPVEAVREAVEKKKTKKPKVTKAKVTPEPVITRCEAKSDEASHEPLEGQDTIDKHPELIWV